MILLYLQPEESSLVVGEVEVKLRGMGIEPDRRWRVKAEAAYIELIARGGVVVWEFGGSIRQSGQRC